MSSRTVPKEEKINLVNLPLEESLIKLSDEHGYIKTSITLSYDNKEKDMETKVPLIKDTVIQYFMSKSSSDFNGNSIENIKSELKNKLNSNIGSEVIKQIYFTNLVIQ